MTWVLIAGLTWVVLAVLAALLIGRAIRLADQRREGTQRTASGNFVVEPARVVRLPIPTPVPVPRPAPAAAPAPVAVVEAAPAPEPTVPTSDQPDDTSEPETPAAEVQWTGHPSLPSMPVVPPVAPESARTSEHAPSREPGLV